MTVAELIAELQELPQDKEIELEIENDGWYDYHVPWACYNKETDSCVLNAGDWIRSIY